MCPCTSCVDSPFRYPLVIEVSDLWLLILSSDGIRLTNLLAEDEVFEQSRASLPCLEAVLFLEWPSNVAGQVVSLVVVKFELSHELSRASSSRGVLIPSDGRMVCWKLTGIACHVRTDSIAKAVAGGESREVSRSNHADEAD